MVSVNCFLWWERVKAFPELKLHLVGQMRGWSKGKRIWRWYFGGESLGSQFDQVLQDRQQET